jgi:hypothetical protein
MHVFLIPLGGSRYELYFEPGEDEAEADADAPDEGRGWFRGLVRRFREALREAEAERHNRTHDAAPPTTLVGRLQRRTMRWIVEKVAEQRLLWHLRTADAVLAAVPDDLADDEAGRIIRDGLQRDADHHLKWLVIEGLALVLSVALVLIPGPNVIGYYLMFTVVGHYFSMRGARRGLREVRWTRQPSAELSALRLAATLAPAQRADRVHEIATRLGLDRLPTFFERLATN